MKKIPLSGRCEVRTDTPIDDVWAVVRDVTRTSEWSHECISVEWLDGATEATPGARFRGRNKAGIWRWGRVCEVVSAEPYELVWQTVSSARYPDSTVWRIALTADGAGTVIAQTFELVKAPKVLRVLFALLIPAHADRSAALTEDLRRIGEVASARALTWRTSCSCYSMSMKYEQPPGLGALDAVLAALVERRGHLTSLVSADNAFASPKNIDHRDPASSDFLARLGLDDPM